MEIRILDDYKIVTDKLNYILQERKLTDPNHKWSKGVTNEKWIDVGYFSKLSHLSARLTELEVKKQVVDNLLELDQKISKIEDKVNSYLERTVLNGSYND